MSLFQRFHPSETSDVRAELMDCSGEIRSGNLPELFHTAKQQKLLKGGNVLQQRREDES